MDDRRLVLLVEDNCVNQRVAQAMLHRLSCTVEIANNGQEAVDRFKTGSYELVFMDCRMPEMDGCTATRLIREYEQQDPDRAHTPIVAMTANAMDSDREACLAAGMDAFIAKPITLQRIAELLAELDAPAPV